MQIILDGVEDVLDFVKLLHPALLVTEPRVAEPPTVVPATDPTLPEYHDEAVQAIRDHLEAVNEAGPAVTEPLSEPDHVIDAPVDGDGVVHHVAWHSDPPKINAGTGLWKARRKRNEDDYQAWLAQCREADAAAADAAASADADDGDAEAEEGADEPLATETHALPVDPDGNTVAVQDELPAPNLETLIAASREAAANAPSDLPSLLDAGKQFISAHSTAAFNALKAAVAPIEGTGSGKAMQTLTPDERQLLRACMDNYPLYV